MGTFLLQVVTHTPVWVWFVLAGLVALGLKQARDHVVSRGRVIFQPVALGLFSLWGAAGAFGLHAYVEGTWLVGLGLGVALGRLVEVPRRVQALDDGRFAIGGSLVPLVMLVTVFLMRYAINVALAIVPALAHETTFSSIAALLYGLPAGLLAARALRVLASTGNKPVLQTA